MPQHIGMVCCSAAGAALCYQTICIEGEALLGPLAHPEVSMHTPSLADYMTCIDRGDWQGVSEIMLASATKLARVGAEFLILPDNTLHQALPHLASQSPLPWLNIAEAVANDAAERQLRCLGVLGTRWLVESDVYPSVFRSRALEHALPQPNERDEVTRIIMDELVRGIFEPTSADCLRRVIDGMATAGCDAVVLACTELPLILNDSSSPLPTLDSTRLLARAALRRAVGA